MLFTVGTLLKTKHHSDVGVQHMLKSIGASGGTIYSSGVRAFHEAGVKVPAGGELVLFAVGDEAGEQGDLFAANLRQFGYVPSAIAHIVNVAPRANPGDTARGAA